MMKHILITILLCLGVLFSPAFAQESFLLERAQAGDAQAQFDLGVMYFYGEGVRQDREKAVYWYCKAAEQGYKDTSINRLLMGWLGGSE